MIQGAKRIATEGVKEGKGPTDVAKELNITAELDPYRSRALHDYERSLFREGILPDRMAEMIVTSFLTPWLGCDKVERRKAKNSAFRQTNRRPYFYNRHRRPISGLRGPGKEMTQNG